jgi:hypothetical protein
MCMLHALAHLHTNLTGGSASHCSCHAWKCHWKNMQAVTEKYGLLGWVVVSQILSRNWCGCDYVILCDPPCQQISCKYYDQEREYGCLISSSTVSTHSLVWLQPVYFWFLAWPSCQTWRWGKLIFSSETWIDIYKIRQGYKEDHVLNSHQCEKLKFCDILYFLCIYFPTTN